MRTLGVVMRPRTYDRIGDRLAGRRTVTSATRCKGGGAENVGRRYGLTARSSKVVIGARSPPSSVARPAREAVVSRS